MDQQNTHLNQITTRWPLITDPAQFVLRYATAIRCYLAAIIRDPHDLEDVIQDFLARVIERGLVQENAVRGRFRDYLKVSVRNAALSHLRRRSDNQAADGQLETIPAENDAGSAADNEWIAEWRGTMLGQALEKLEDQERLAPAGRLYLTLTLARDHPEADSVTLAELAAKKSGRPMTPEAFRKQLSRARTVLANLLVDEVRRTIENATPEQIDEELAELGLQELVRPFRE
ncbi:RNA polymerase sigma factor [Zavarzinella formosa]|uniref:RNA polymerase sigma factor n=1 Tax=Zavarzinella formosa TaxID=360055 RepID=UPI0002D9B75E|nr:sigma-70 family RNA polymerase sigma factor [Zavarzinella formosa]